MSLTKLPGFTLDTTSNVTFANANVSGNLTAGNANLGNLVTANFFVGNGSLLTGITITGAYSNTNTAAYLTANPQTGTYSNTNTAAYLPTYNGNISANYFIGNGSTLANITGANITGNAPFAGTAHYANTANAVSGTNVSGNVTSAVQSNFANIANSVTFANVSGTPTTISGYGITDAYSNTNTAAYLTANPPTGTYSNTNTAAYLPTYTGNFTAGNINLSFTTTSTANLGNSVRANYVVGNGYYLTGVDLLTVGNADIANAIANGNSNISTPYANGPITVSITGTSNTVIFTSTGVNVAGTLNVGGNVIVGNLTVNGTTTTVNSTTTRVVDPIIELGANANGATLTSDDNKDRGLLLHYYSGSAAADAFMGWDDSNAEFAFASNASFSSEVATFNAFGNVRAAYFKGDGSQLTGITGTYSNTNTAAYLTTYTGNLTAGNINLSYTTTSTANLGNVVRANYFVGNGAFLTGVDLLSVGNADIANSIANGTSNINTPTANGNITVSIGGTANTVVFANTGNYITTTGNMKASYYFGDGSQLTGIDGSYSNTNTAAYLTANPQTGTYSNTNTAAYLTSNPPAGSYSNTNVASYLTTATFTTTGNITSNVNTANTFSGNLSQTITATAYSYTFTGATNYLRVAHNTVFDLATSNPSFTIEFWMYCTTLPSGTNAWICNKDGGLNYSQYGFRIDSNGALIFLVGHGENASTQNGTEQNFTVISSVSTNTWYHVAACQSATNQIKVFSNGVLVSTTTRTQPMVDGGLSLTIGAAQAGNEFFIGKISNFRLLKGTAQYSATFTPATSTLTNITNTKLLTAQSTTIIDNSTANSGSGWAITTTGTVTPSTSSPFEGLGNAAIVSATIGGSDAFRIYVGSTGTDAGYAEIATGDNGTEPIYFRQYSSAGFGTIARTLTILDASGDTYIPGKLTTTGNIVANAGSFFLGNGYYLTGVDQLSVGNADIANSLANGTSNINTPTSNGNITVSIGGTANTVIFANTGVSVAGTLNVTGNAFVGNLTVTGTTTTVNSTTTRVVDPIFELGGGANGAALSTDDNKDRGLLLHYYSGSGTVDAFMGWDDSNGEFGFGSNVSVSSEVITWNSYANVRGNYFIGDGSLLTGVDVLTVGSAGSADVANSIANGTSNVNSPYLNGPITVGIGGAANAVVFTSTGINVAGYSNIGGTVTAGTGTGGSITGANAITSNYFIGTLTTAAQPNITSVGTLTSLTAGNINLSYATTSTANLGNVVRANYFVGNGAFLTGVDLLSVGNADIANSIANGTSNINTPTSNGNITVSIGGTANTVVFANSGNYIVTTGNVKASYYFGDGSQLTGITGTYSNTNTAAYLTANPQTGTYSNTNTAAYLPTYTGNLIPNNITSTSNGNITLSGSLSQISGANLISGTYIAGTLTTSAQPNITSTGTLTSLTVSGNATVGNLTVTGTTTSVNSTVTRIVDPIIELGGGANGAALAVDDNKDRGLLLHYYSGSAAVDAFMGWDDSNSEFAFSSNASFASEVTTFNSFGNIRAAYYFGDGSQLTGIAGSYSNTNVASYLTSNPPAGTYSNTNTAAYLTTYTGNLTAGNINLSYTTTSTANLGNAVTANFFTGNGSLLTGISGTYSNTNTAAYLTANPQTGTYSNTNTAAYLTSNPPAGTYSNTNTAAYLTSNPPAGTYSNTNTAAYLATATFTTTGNITANVITATTLTAGNGTITGNIAFTGANVSLGSTSSVRISGGAANYFLKTDGAGNLSWATPSGGVGGTSLTYTTSTSPPASGNLLGDQWFNTSSNVLYEYLNDGTAAYWVDISSPSTSSNGSLVGAITIQDEGSNLTNAVSSINFVGSAVTASNIGNAVTVTITADTVSPFLLMGA